MNTWPSIIQIQDDLRNGKTTAQELVAKSLASIEKNKSFNAIISVNREAALKKAMIVDEKIANGQSIGRLAGIPFIAKDNFLTTVLPTTAASNMLKSFKAPYQSTAINRLEDQDAILVAKANLDAFAHGASTENSDFMITKNPFDPTRVPGGSSGGSAASIMLDMAVFALGTDTGGSIRTPASFCGLVGYKPSYGLVSRSGVVAMGSSLDVIGPITSNVSDASLVVDVISGRDSLDSTTIERDDESYVVSVQKQSLQGIKVGLITDFLKEGIEPAIKDNVLSRVDRLKKIGATIIDIELPAIELSLPVYYIICPAEVSSNLSRYDGLRFGYHESLESSLDDFYLSSRSNGFGKEAKRRIMIGTYVLSSGYYDAYYKKAQQVRTKIIEGFNKAFTKVDFLIGPTSPTLPFKIGERVNDPIKMYLADVMTVAANLVGVPAISMPSGFIDNLPTSIQIMSPFKSDKKLLQFANSIEREIL